MRIAFRRFRGSRPTLILVAVVATLALAAAVRAIPVPGGGPPKQTKNDCLATFDVDGISAATAANAVECTDGDPSCDFDGACNDSCEFQVALCANQSNVTGCTPPTTALKTIKEGGPKKKRVGLPLPTGSACGAFIAAKVDVKTTKRGKKDGKRVVRVIAIAEGKPKRKDTDALTLTCKVRTGTCPPQKLGKLAFTFSPGTTDCGGAGLATPPAVPFSGALWDGQNGGGTKISDLGRGCLYFGGGLAVNVPPGPIPNGSKTVLDVTGDPNALTDDVTLVGSKASGRADCTLGPLATKHCANDETIACTSNGDCPATAANPCQPDSQCSFGPPLPIRNGPLSTCVVNVLAAAAGGTANLSTGAVNLTSYSLTSRVYLTGAPNGDDSAPCPKCLSGTCAAGERVNLPCTAVGTLSTTLDCPPTETAFLGPLAVNLAPLSTTASVRSAADGIFCPDKFCSNGRGACTDDAQCETGTCNGQPNAGAFGQSATRSITETGSPAGDIRDGLTHNATLAYTFCIPAPGEPATSSADLPGPGAVSLAGTLQFQAQ